MWKATNNKGPKTFTIKCNSIMDLRRREDWDADLSDGVVLLDAVERELGELDDLITDAVDEVVVVDVVVSTAAITATSARYFTWKLAKVS